jgi:hypothetical protein
MFIFNINLIIEIIIKSLHKRLMQTYVSKSLSK